MANRFVFVAPAYNASKTVERMLSSIFLQTWSNWLVLIKDDMSTDDTVWNIIQTCTKYGIKWAVRTEDSILGAFEGAKVVVDVNDTKKWEVQNVLEMIRDSLVKDDDIICRVDCDDHILNTCALQNIDLVYSQTNCDVLWTNHVWDWNFTKNISGPMPGGYIFQPDEKSGLIKKLSGKKDPYNCPWTMSHLKTFRRDLFNNISEENFRGEDGEYIKRTGDQAIYLPIIYKSQIPVYLPITTYFYTIDDKPETYQTDDAKYQANEAKYIRSRGFVK